MANTVANKAKNIAADAVVAATIEIQLHTAAGANSNGTSGTILTTRKNLTAGRFGAASAGSVDTDNAEAFGVLSTSQSRTVRAYSGWLSSDDGFLWIADMTTAVVVAANEEFEMNAGGIGFQVT